MRVNDSGLEQPSLEVDPDTGPVLREVFAMSLRGRGLKDIRRHLNNQGIAIKGRRWHRAGLHYILTNEVFTGTAVWGCTSKTGKTTDPVRVDGMWPALVSRETFDAVQQTLHERAPTRQWPAAVGSPFLLSGLLRCRICGNAYTGQAAKSGRYAYYVCNTLQREGVGACTARYLNAAKVEDFVVDKVKERILTDESIAELITLLAEEIESEAGDAAGSLTAIEAELADVESRLDRRFEALESGHLTLEVLSPRILSLRSRQDQLNAAREEARARLVQRKRELPSTAEITGYARDFRALLERADFPERKALIRNFVRRIDGKGNEATFTYTIPMPPTGATRDDASVLEFV